MSGRLFVSILGRNEIDCFGLSHILTQAGLVVDRTMAGGEDAGFAGWRDQADHVVLIDRSKAADAVPPCEMLRAALPHARLAILCDQCDLDVAREAFALGVDGILMTHMASDPLVCAIRLIAMGTKVMPSHLIQELVESSSGSSWQDIQSGQNLPELSEREIQILQCLAAGDANKEIAARLTVAEATVKAHVKAILRKLQVDNRTQAAIWAINQGKTGENEDNPIPPSKH